jgi:hypothetical protein
MTQSSRRPGASTEAGTGSGEVETFGLEAEVAERIALLREYLEPESTPAPLLPRAGESEGEGVGR